MQKVWYLHVSIHMRTHAHINSLPLSPNEFPEYKVGLLLHNNVKNLHLVEESEKEKIPFPHEHWETSGICWQQEEILAEWIKFKHLDKACTRRDEMAKKPDWSHVCKGWKFHRFPSSLTSRRIMNTGKPTGSRVGRDSIETNKCHRTTTIVPMKPTTTILGYLRDQHCSQCCQLHQYIQPFQSLWRVTQYYFSSTDEKTESQKI